MFEGGAGEYALGTPYHTHPLDSNGKPTDAYIFPVLHNGEFWRTLDIIELDGETRHQFSPNVEKFQHLHGLSSPENPIRFVWVGNVRYAVVGNNAEIITHEGGRIPDNIGELAVQSDLPDSVVIDISKPIAVAEIATENMAVPNWDEICSSIRMLPQDFTFVVNLNDGSNVTVCGHSAQPVQILNDAVDILLTFAGGVGVVQAQVELAAILVCDGPVDVDGLGAADVQVAVGLRREAGMDLADFAFGEVGVNDLGQKVFICHSGVPPVRA